MSSASTFQKAPEIPHDGARSQLESLQRSNLAFDSEARSQCAPYMAENVNTRLDHMAAVKNGSAALFSSSYKAGVTSPGPPALHLHSATFGPPPSSQSQSYSQTPTFSEESIPTSLLRIETDLTAPIALSPPLSHRESPNDNTNLSPSRIYTPLNRKTSTGSLYAISRTPSLKAALNNAFGSISGTSSAMPSPVINAMGDISPLPSPLLSGDSPGPWKRLNVAATSPPPRRGRLSSVGEGTVLATGPSEAINIPRANSSRRKPYTPSNGVDEAAVQVSSKLGQPQVPQHTRNRSLSEYTPDATAVAKRLVTVSGSHVALTSKEPLMRREQNLAESRGLTPAVAIAPTPRSGETSNAPVNEKGTHDDDIHREYFDARGRKDHKLRRWLSIGPIGQGTFSRVMLATSQLDVGEDVLRSQSGSSLTSSSNKVDRKTLVAVKVCEQGPKGGANETRVEMSLKRELEIMQSIHHPSLVDLKAWNIELTRAILVLSYSPGGDLFDIANQHRSVLTPTLMRRIAAELVSAVRYLHKELIVHRDIKLENVLVNLTPTELADPRTDWTTYPYPVVALADMGLSRRITPDLMLETRCGSEDYAAAEVVMGQPYDGRATDAWSLGVLLYALLEARLPFDPLPGSSRMRSRTSHRIARVEWRWVQFGGQDGDHDADEAKFKEKGLLGAMLVIEGLLKRSRSRWTMDQVATEPWIEGGIAVDGGLRFREEVEGAEL